MIIVLLTHCFSTIFFFQECSKFNDEVISLIIFIYISVYIESCCHSKNLKYGERSSIYSGFSSWGFVVSVLSFLLFL